MQPREGIRDVWLWLTAPIAILVLWVAGTGVVSSEEIYNQGASFLVAQGMGQDIVTLCIALPGLIVSAFFVHRSSQRARLVWLGILGYLTYTYALFSFDVHFNHLFPGFVALFGCSLYAIVGGILSLNHRDIPPSFGRRWSVKIAAWFLLTTTVLFYILWLREVGQALIAGNIPQRALDAATPTYGVHVIDMAVLLPAFAISAGGLWRKKPWGFICAGVLLVLLVTLGTALVGIQLSMLVAGFSTQIGRLVMYGVFTLIGLAIAIPYLRAFSG